MPETKNHTDTLIKTFSADYVEKLFYFFLKKAGNADEANDLTSETAIEIIYALRKGIVPIYFSAWVWKIARNRYCLWAAKKHQTAESVSGADFNELDVADEYSVESEFERSEEIKALRRELAFISAEYRDIVVAYYIDDRKVRDIALSLNLPEGTVKTRLFKARNILKEGMNMAREFGVKSYKPEDVSFVASGSQPSGLPWSAVQRKIPKNIILQANNNPSTIEELSVELGVATPYMEEEVEILTNGTLLKKVDNNKYITNFFIADKECQNAIYQAQRRQSKERSDMIDTMITESMEKIKKLNLMRNGMSDADFKWLLIILATDYIKNFVSFDIYSSMKRPDGGDWGFMGFESNNAIIESTMMGHNGSGNGRLTMSWAYKINDYNLCNRAGELEYQQTLLLGDIIKNNRNYSSLTSSEKGLFKPLEENFVSIGKDGKIIPNIAVFENGDMEKFYKIIKAHKFYKKLQTMIQQLYDEIILILKSYSNPVLHEQLDYYASMFMCDIRMMTVHDEVDAGKLIVPSEPEKSTIAMYLVIN